MISLISIYYLYACGPSVMLYYYFYSDINIVVLMVGRFTLENVGIIIGNLKSVTGNVLSIIIIAIL